MIQNASLIAVVCGVGLAAAIASADGYRPQIGRLHPDFTLPKLADGSPVSLSQFRGRKVLLIHFASW
ncbi:MAG: hypothetical protein V3R99_09250 [Thermoguttaceae bacterium]